MKAGDEAVDPDALVLGMVACRDNARELIAEADLLAEHGLHARAYALLHTACEELGKFGVLEIGVRGLVGGRPPRWKRFWQRFRSHDSKSAQLEVQLLMLAASSEEADDPAGLATTIFGLGLAVRNAALYVDRGPDGGFRKPSSLGFEVPLPGVRMVAEHALAAADQRGATTAEIEAHMRRGPDAGMIAKMNFVLTKAVERMRDLGMTREQVRELVTKTYSTRP